ncbi:MAG: FtsW/RodA/SpoVE family cell cycle protein, partial [Gammaproteobacteria bacterium]|nr:FtsW/RodA/SpoVE family cell cycle protein [Gammaproteobacteria bacterium]
MNMATAVKMPQAERSGSPPNLLLVVLCLLLTIGLLMMTSASLEIAGSQYGDSFYYFKRQLLFVGIGLGVLVITLHIPMRFWYRMGYPLLLVSVCLLWLVLYVGKNVGGSVRWLDLGVFNLQPSEMAKVFVVLFTAAYLERHIEKVRERWLALFILLGLVSVAVGLILLEPDHGISGIMVVTVFCMIFLAGIKIGRLIVMLTLGIVALVSYAQMKSYEYLIARFQSFLEPCAPEYVYSSGYQLCQALIGFGRGEWYGVGLGSSIQKLYFLPEAHNDFLLAIIGEELGLLGVAAVILLFCLLVGKGFSIA